MKPIVDARGLSGPERALLMERGIEIAEAGEVMVLAADDSEKGEIIHAARNHGWMLRGIESRGESYWITVSKH